MGNLVNLKRHYKRHENSVHYECDICSKGFQRPEYLKKHMKVSHWEKQKEKCNVCDVFISGTSNLKLHLKEVHSFGINEKCVSCDKNFSRKKDLKEHYVRVHYKNEFMC